MPLASDSMHQSIRRFSQNDQVSSASSVDIALKAAGDRLRTRVVLRQRNAITPHVDLTF